MMPLKKILIVGNGNWGSTVHGLLTSEERYPDGKPNLDVRIYGPEMDGEKVLTYGNGVAKWPNEALRDGEDADLIVFAVASKFMRDTANTFAQYKPRQDAVLLNLAKGIVYDDTQKEIYLMHEILRDAFPEHKNIASLAGANIAKEVRHKPFRPTSTTIATLKDDKKLHDRLRNLFSVYRFTVRQHNPEILALELGSAIKNPVAFGSGVIHGYFEEEARQAGSKDPRQDSMMSDVFGDYIDVTSQEGEYMFHLIAGTKGLKRRIPYSVLGDLVTTAISRDSRNFKAGYLRGVAQYRRERISIEEICEKVGQAVESVTTVKSLREYFISKKWWKEHFIVFKKIDFIMHDLLHIEEAADTLSQGHPRISKLQAMMEARAKRNLTNSLENEPQ